jgi:adenylate cyclase
MPKSPPPLRPEDFFDLASPEAAACERRFRWLVEHGAAPQLIARSLEQASFVMAAAALARKEWPTLTIAEGAAIAWLPLEDVLDLYFAAGLGHFDADSRILTEPEAEALAVFGRASRLFGSANLRRFVQVIGTSLSRLSEATVSLLVGQTLARLHAEGRDDTEIADAQLAAAGLLPSLSACLAHFYRMHVDTVAGPKLTSGHAEGRLDTMTLAVGFLDLVGFTRLARERSTKELAGILDRFEETARDVATANNGRVVKFIGDEVMFVAESGATACRLALDLIESFAEDASVNPRGAIAVGPVLVRGGDYYGPTVNLAARAAAQATRSEILVTENIGGEDAPGLRFEAAGRRQLRGFEDPVRFLSVERA